MSCSPFDLRDYFLAELTPGECRQVDAHLKSCAACGEELDRLRLTQSVLLALRDEEMPQRIGFVSDPVFEPSGLRRAWRAFWGSGARLAFAGAAMLSVAILVSALTRPAPAPALSAIDRIAIERQFEAKLDQAVRKAVAQSEERQARKTAELLAAADRRNELDRKALLLAVQENFDVMRKRLNVMIVASNDVGQPR